jgi:hypothetical protein
MAKALTNNASNEKYSSQMKLFSAISKQEGITKQ